MPLPLSWFSATVADNTVKANGEPESSNYRVAITTLTPANVAATETLAGNLLTAVQGVTIGANLSKELTYSKTLLGSTPAASTLAQRENKWLCRYHDATNFQKFQVSLPCADLTKLDAGEEFLDLTAGEGLALKTAFEAVVVSPNDSAHATVLDTVQFVGRNT